MEDREQIERSAKTVDEIILGDYLSPSQLFQAERITVYAVDTVNKEVYDKSLG